MKYKCIKGFSVEKYDGDGFLIENKYCDIEIGSLWETDTSISVVGGEVRLLSLGGEFEWLEISRETLDSHFEEDNLRCDRCGAGLLPTSQICLCEKCDAELESQCGNGEQANKAQEEQ